MKKLNKSGRKEDKVLLFPDLQERLLQKAMAEFEGKKYREARGLFGKLLELNPRERKGLYGWTICSIQLREFQRAEEAVKQLMELGTAHDADVFRLYLTILIERKDYRTALQEIARMEKEPAFRDLRGFLTHMKKFCQRRLEEGPLLEQIPEKGDAIASVSGGLKNGEKEPLNWACLETGDPELQVRLIRNLTSRLGKDDLEEIQKFLLDEAQNPAIKTVLLCAIHERKLASSVAVRKFGHVYQVVFDDQFLNKDFTEQIEEATDRALLSENPTLAGSAKELLRLFMVNVYPEPVNHILPETWAAFFAVQAAAAGKNDGERQRLLSLFRVSEDQYDEAYRMVRQAEKFGIWSDNELL